MVSSVDEAASVIRRVADEMLSLNGRQLVGTDSITVDPTQVAFSTVIQPNPNIQYSSHD